MASSLCCVVESGDAGFLVLKWVAAGLRSTDPDLDGPPDPAARTGPVCR